MKESRIHGTGLFAKATIAKGEIVAVKGGYILNRDQWAKIEKKLRAAEIQIAENLFIAPVRKAQREGCMLYTNHSCDPNIAIQGQIIFVGMRDIASGEELTHDWATTDDLEYEMECNCGSPKCRGRVTGKDWMKVELQKKYAGYFAWHVQRKIDILVPNSSRKKKR